ncbi:MAG: TIGR03617 family F420-dependent LLM class oxidoreductase [Chloroflexota bacterium]|nr:TIGR03617 family F420-dependent LLM class oxidoreductase [Dehalococcoidia bacterium]MDW8255214.1 TIGR03617 family F420-dependent LLM class oxidoreductase [Chloroflexota bacterium]
MKIELALRVLPPSRVAPLARLAEEAGFDAVSVNETARDSVVAVTAAAAATRRIEVATSVTLAFPRSPTVTAMAAWDLQELSGGRFTLGLGSQVRGHLIRRFGVEWRPPVPRMRDYVGALRALWHAFATGAPLNYQSEHYRLTLLTREFNPGPQPFPPPRVHLAAVNPAMCRLAGEIADGLRTHPLMTPRYLETVVLPAVRAGRERGGRAGQPFDLVAASFQALGDSDEAVARAREEARRMIAFYASTPAYRPVLSTHGLDDLGEKLARMAAAGQWDHLAAEVADDVLDTFTLSGRLDDLPRLVAERYQGLVTRFALFSPPRELLADRDRLAALVRALRDCAIPAAF